jgi:choline dehydrogenase-like flavoprotein
MNTTPFDAIVVGSGAGGAAAAWRLVSAGVRVLLLEKGSYLPTDGSTLDVERVVRQGEFLSHEPWMDGHGNSIRPEEHFNVGGKTKWYGAALLRFSRGEFESDAAHDCRGWPFDAEILEPYYAEAERLLGVRTFECEPDLARILRRAAPAGRAWATEPLPLGLAPGILAEPNEAMHFDGFASARGLKAEAEQSLLRRLEQDERLTLVTNAEVRTLIGHRDSPETVVGVRLADGREFRAPRVLLAAGALHSPRLLARYVRVSGISGELPGARLIGRFLKLHLLTAMIAVSRRRVSDLLRKTMLITNECYPHSSVQPLGFDAELIASLVPKQIPRFISQPVGSRAYGFFLQTEEGSSSANRVQDYGADDVPPVLDYDEARVPAARSEHRAFTRGFQLALARAGLLGLTQRIGLNGTAHACGTLICGSDPAESVVNAQGRVHGMRGLYVVDGSVLPRISRVNPALTIYAWALRTADLLARELRAGAAADAALEVSHAG